MVNIYASILDKNISLSSNNFGNKYDNGVRQVIFNSIEDNGNLTNKYVAFLNPNDDFFLLPLNEENSFIVTTNLTLIAGKWTMLYIATNNEIVDGQLDDTYKSYVSNVVSFNITDNFIDDRIEEIVEDENLKIWYETLEQTIAYLSGDTFRESVVQEVLDKFELTEQNINQITTTLKNDKTFKQEVKGDKGDKGDPGEQGPIGPAGSNGADGFSPVVSSTKIVDGNKLIIQDSTHTEEIDILNGEKGEPGEDGIGIYQEWINNNKYDVGLVDGSKPFYWNKNILETILSQSPFYDQQIVLKTDATVLKYIHNDRVFNVYNASDLNNRVGWITLSEEIQKDKESSYFTLNTSTEFISVLDSLFLKVPFLYITEYTETYMKGPKGDSFKYEDFTHEQLESLKGPKGDKGDKGDTGEQGPAGNNGQDGQNGADGKSAYQSWLDLGNVGTEDDFINSIKGDKGEPGYTPVRGTDYWTAEDIQTIKDYCKNYIDTDIIGGAS